MTDIPAAKTRVDPVTVAVIQGALENIAVEIGHKLLRMSYSSIIRESENFGAALTDAAGRQLCECRMSTPLQAGPIPGYVRGILRTLERRGETLPPGDVIMHNDPYAGASHGPDVGFCVPVFLEGALIGFSVTTAHHLDIGALTPGSCGIVDAVDTYAEGLQFKAVKVFDQGVRNDAVWHMLRGNIRSSDLVVGDMEAQIKGPRLAPRATVPLSDNGLGSVNAAYEDLLDYSERLMRDVIRALPDGTYRALTHIDGYLDDPDPTHRDLPLAVAITVADDEIAVDLTGTAPHLQDKPINMPLEGTVDRAVWLTLRSILIDSAVYGHIPQNSGLTRPITIVAPRGALANPIFPAPVIARFCPGNQLADTVMKALAEVVPEKVSAGIGNLRVVAFSGLQDGRHWVHMEIMKGSYGGRPRPRRPRYALRQHARQPGRGHREPPAARVNSYELRPDAAAAGEWRGGIGTVREFTFLGDGGFSIEGDGHRYAPCGFAGGADRYTALLKPVTTAGGEVTLPSKVPYRKAEAGDRLVSIGPSSGGGYGDPARRDPAAVHADVRDGLISAEQAAKSYGVASARAGTA